MHPEFEKLEDIGDFGLDCGIEFAVIKQKLDRGYSNRITIGSSTGTFDWRLVFNVLPGTTDGGIMFGEELQSRADYLWEFFCRHLKRNSRSFVITDPRSGKDYLVGFAENRLSYRMFAAKLFSSGIALEYRSEPGVATLEDGSLGILDNPDSF